MESLVFARRAKTKYLGTRTMSDWKKVSEFPLPPNVEVRMYNPEWEDEFTPTGTVTGVFLACEEEGKPPEGEIIGTFWDNDQDYWVTKECDPTHWTLPDFPQL
jgi:hypothetical protein